MKKKIRIKALKYVSAGVALAAISMLGIAQDQPPMSFFVISVGDGLFYCFRAITNPSLLASMRTSRQSTMDAFEQSRNNWK